MGRRKKEKTKEVAAKLSCIEAGGEVDLDSCPESCRSAANYIGLHVISCADVGAARYRTLGDRLVPRLRKAYRCWVPCRRLCCNISNTGRGKRIISLYREGLAAALSEKHSHQHSTEAVYIHPNPT